MITVYIAIAIVTIIIKAVIRTIQCYNIITNNIDDNACNNQTYENK